VKNGLSVIDDAEAIITQIEKLGEQTTHCAPD